MRLGRIVGKVWATVKDEQLKAVKLAILDVVDEKQNPTGTTFIAVDTVGAGDGDLVYWVGGAEATCVFPDRKIPSDVSIVGLVDSLDM